MKRINLRWIGLALGAVVLLLLTASALWPGLSAHLMAYATPSISPLHNFLAAMTTEPSGATMTLATAALAVPFASRASRLSAKLEAVTAQMRGIHEAAGDEPLTAEQSAQWEKLKGERETLTTALGQVASQAEFERTAPAVASAAGNGAPVIAVGKNRAEDAPWPNLGAFLMAVKAADANHIVDPRLTAAASGMGEQIAPDGGYAIPLEFAQGIEKNMWEMGNILSRVSQRPIDGNSMTFQVINETSRADGSRRGGVLGYWVDEGTAPTASQIKLARIELKLRKLGCVGYMTDELTQDAPALQAELTSAFAEELTFKAEDAIINGLGHTHPLGILNAPCLISQAKETNQAATSIVTTNLSKMWARLPARSQLDAVWLINVDCQQALDELALPVGTAALQPRFINYGPTGILQIKGRDVIPVEYCQTLGTPGDIILCDLSQYRVIRKATGVQQDSSIHVRFLQDETTFRALYRIDGQPLPRSAITPKNGAVTLSPFIDLAVRA
jgi:HK97 family phage major capsid protein